MIYLMALYLLYHKLMSLHPLVRDQWEIQLEDELIRLRKELSWLTEIVKSRKKQKCQRNNPAHKYGCACYVTKIER